MTAVLEGGEWSAARLVRNLTPGKTRYPFYRRLGGPQGWSGRAKNLVPTGIRSRTFQPVVIRYTDWARFRIGQREIVMLCSKECRAFRVGLWYSVGIRITVQKWRLLHWHIVHALNRILSPSKSQWKFLWNKTTCSRDRSQMWVLQLQTELGRLTVPFISNCAHTMKACSGAVCL